MLPQASLSTFGFELPPYPTGSSVPVFHLLAPCTGTYVEDWMGLDIAVCAVGKVSDDEHHFSILYQFNIVQHRTAED